MTNNQTNIALNGIGFYGKAATSLVGKNRLKLLVNPEGPAPEDTDDEERLRETYTQRRLGYGIPSQYKDKACVNTPDEAQKLGLGPWRYGEKHYFRGKYTVKPYSQRVFVIVYCFEKVENVSGFGESIIAVPKEWISTCWKFVACPFDEFYFPSAGGQSEDDRYRAVVDTSYHEFPVSKFAKLFGWRFVEDANNCIAKAQNSKPYQYMSGENDEHGNPTFWSDPENVASTLARGQYAAAVARAGIPPPVKFNPTGAANAGQFLSEKVAGRKGGRKQNKENADPNRKVPPKEKGQRRTKLRTAPPGRVVVPQGVLTQTGNEGGEQQTPQGGVGDISLGGVSNKPPLNFGPSNIIQATITKVVAFEAIEQSGKPASNAPSTGQELSSGKEFALMTTLPPGNLPADENPNKVVQNHNMLQQQNQASEEDERRGKKRGRPAKNMMVGSTSGTTLGHSSDVEDEDDGDEAAEAGSEASEGDGDYENPNGFGFQDDDNDEDIEEVDADENEEENDKEIGFDDGKGGGGSGASPVGQEAVTEDPKDDVQYTPSTKRIALDFGNNPRKILKLLTTSCSPRQHQDEGNSKACSSNHCEDLQILKAGLAYLMQQALKQELELKKKKEENSFVNAPKKHNIDLPIDKFEDLKSLNDSLEPVMNSKGEKEPSPVMIDMMRYLRTKCEGFVKTSAKAKICLQNLITPRLCCNVVMEAKNLQMKFGSSGPSSDPAVTSGPQSQSQAAVSSPADSGGGPSTNNVIGATPSREETMGVFDVVEGELHTLTNLITLIFRVIQHESECPTDYKARIMITAFRSQVAQKHSSICRAKLKTAESIAEARGLERAQAWVPWSTAQRALKYREIKSEMSFAYPNTRA